VGPTTVNVTRGPTLDLDFNSKVQTDVTILTEGTRILGRTERAG
jgi:hypothetical protein